MINSGLSWDCPECETHATQTQLGWGQLWDYSEKAAKFMNRRQCGLSNRPKMWHKNKNR